MPQWRSHYKYVGWLCQGAGGKPLLSLRTTKLSWSRARGQWSGKHWVYLWALPPELRLKCPISLVVLSWVIALVVILGPFSVHRSASTSISEEISPPWKVPESKSSRRPCSMEPSVPHGISCIVRCPSPQGSPMKLGCLKARREIRSQEGKEKIEDWMQVMKVKHCNLFCDYYWSLYVTQLYYLYY